MDLFLPELFYQIITNLNDKEKIFLTSSSKITHNFKSLLILDSEYNLEEINDKWHMKNIIIKDLPLENKIRKLLRDLIYESIVVRSKYVRFVSNNTNIKLFLNENTIKKLVSYKCYYLAVKIILNNDGSVDDINKQFLKASYRDYSGAVKLLINSGANIRYKCIDAIIGRIHGSNQLLIIDSVNNWWDV